MEVQRDAVPLVQPTQGDRWAGIGAKVAGGTAVVSSVAAAARELADSLPETAVTLLLLVGGGVLAGRAVPGHGAGDAEGQGGGVMHENRLQTYSGGDEQVCIDARAHYAALVAAGCPAPLVSREYDDAADRYEGVCFTFYDADGMLGSMTIHEDRQYSFYVKRGDASASGESPIGHLHPDMLAILRGAP